MSQVDIKTVRLMEKLGGSFVSAIAEAWFVADAHNKILLETTFKHYFDAYKDMANVDDSIDHEIDAIV